MAESGRTVKSSQIEGTAYHEAGHAVTAHLMRRRIRRASIVEDDVSYGHVAYWAWPKSFHPDYQTDARTVRLAEAGAITDLGGVVAQEIFTGGYDWEGARSDVHAAVDLVSYLCGGPEATEAYLSRLLGQTRELLSEPRAWAAVQALADELLRCERLGASRVRGIVHTALSFTEC